MREVRVALDESTGRFYGVPELQGWVGNEVRLVESSRPDFVFFGPFARGYRWPALGRFAPRRRPPRGRYVRIFWSGEPPVLDFEAYDWLFTLAYDEELGHPRHLRLPWWHPDLAPGRAPEPPVRPRFCNFVYSAPDEHRESFCRKLADYRPVDCPGRRLNNMPSMGSRESRSWAEEKVEFLKDYKFTIAFENRSVPGYATEKLYQPMLAGSIPIYWGNPLVHRDYNAASFVNVHEFASEDEAIERVIALDRDPDLYRQTMLAPWYDAGHIERHTQQLRRRFAEIFRA